MLKDVLTPGAQYDFVLRADLHGVVQAFASVRVTVNRPPFGGDLTLSHRRPLVALGYESQVHLKAGQWMDDESDLPLRYSFRRVRLLLWSAHDVETSYESESESEAEAEAEAEGGVGVGGEGALCQAGLLNTGTSPRVCCDAACGTCGGSGCGARSGGQAGCCKQAI